MLSNMRINHKNLAYITQTTLSVDDTKDIIEILKSKFPTFMSLKKKIFAMQLRTDRKL